MKILHIINNGSSDLARQIIAAQSKDHDVKVVELAKRDISYDEIIDDIFSYDRVVSW